MGNIISLTDRLNQQNNQVISQEDYQFVRQIIREIRAAGTTDPAEIREILIVLSKLPTFE